MYDTLVEMKNNELKNILPHKMDVNVRKRSVSSKRLDDDLVEMKNSEVTLSSARGSTRSKN